MDGHPNSNLRRTFNINVFVMVYVMFLDIVFMAWYSQPLQDTLVFFISMFSVLLNTAWLLLPDKYKLKSVANDKVVCGFFILQSVILIGLLSCFYLFFVTTLNYPYIENDYFWTDIWLWTNLFLMLVAAFNIVHVYAFTRHIYETRRLVFHHFR